MRNPENEKWLRNVFMGYLGRYPTDQEVGAYLTNFSSHEAIMHKIAYSNESMTISSPFSRTELNNVVLSGLPEPIRPKRTAVQISGHLRFYEKVFPYIYKHLILPNSADVFIHTWDARGNQIHSNSIAPVPDNTQAVDIELAKQLLVNVKLSKVESADEVLNTIQNPTDYLLYGIVHRGKVGGSAEPKYITSQLYSMHQASLLREAHERQQNQKYDTVIRLRADYLPTTPIDAREHTADDLTIWVPNGISSGHAHPPCRRCKLERHTGPHGADICDVFSVGTSEAISKYCHLYTQLDEIYYELNLLNSKWSSEESGRKFVKYAQWNTINIWAMNSHKYHCYYPERIFREYLKNYRLLPSGISGSVCRG